MKNLSDYNYGNPHLASMLYNLRNDLLMAASRALNGMTDGIVIGYKEQISKIITTTAVLSSIFALLILIQAFIGYSLNSVAISQIDIFFRLPIRYCIRMEKSASEFLNMAHVLLKPHTNIHTGCFTVYLFIHTRNICVCVYTKHANIYI